MGRILGAVFAASALLGCGAFNLAKLGGVYSVSSEPRLVEVSPLAPEPPGEATADRATVTLKWGGWAEGDRVTLSSWTGEFSDMYGEVIPGLRMPRTDFSAPLVLAPSVVAQQEIHFDLAPIRAYFEAHARTGGQFVICRLSLQGEDAAHHTVTLITDVPFRWGEPSP